MDLTVAAMLVQDGIASGAVYVLMALALVLVFAVTRIIFIPQGEFVVFGAFTLSALQGGQWPHAATLLVAMGALVFIAETCATLRNPDLRRRAGRGLAWHAGKYLAFPWAVYLLAAAATGQALPMPAQVALTLLIVAPMGPFLYRLAYEPLAEASTLVLLIASVGVHLVLLGLGLVMFGAEGVRTQPFSGADFALGELQVSAQSLWVVGVSAAMVGGLYLYFEHSLSGKALRATAVNRRGARLVGIGTAQAGKLAFTLVALIGTLCGILIAPISTVYYDSGFLICLKGFVGAIVGALVSYPMAAGGALLVAMLESFSAFYASAFKEVIVFTLIIPVLLWRSLAGAHGADEE